MRGFAGARTASLTPAPSVLNPAARAHFRNHPFPHVVIDGAFTDEFFAALRRELEEKRARGLSEAVDPQRFARFGHYDAYSLVFNPKDRTAATHFLFTREWQSYINAFFNLELDNNTLVESHHHQPASRDGYVHNDYQVAHFVRDPVPGELNGWYHQVPYRGGSGPLRTVRAIAVMIYVGNPPWAEGDGGETALYEGPDAERPPAELVAPLENRILAFEVSPRSYHAFQSNQVHERNTIAQWFHAPLAFAKKRYHSEPDSGLARPRNALLVGATGILGKGFRDHFADRYRIVGVARHRPKGFEGSLIAADVAVDAERIVDEALKAMGSVDVLINAAVRYDFKPLLEASHDDILRQFEVNVLAPLALARALVKKSWNRKDENLARNRNIVMVSSLSALQAFPGGQGIYSATKAALNALTVHLALELSELGIRVNGIAPDAFPGRLTPEAVAASIVALDGTSSSAGVHVVAPVEEKR